MEVKSSEFQRNFVVAAATRRRSSLRSNDHKNKKSRNDRLEARTDYKDLFLFRQSHTDLFA